MNYWINKWMSSWIVRLRKVEVRISFENWEINLRGSKNWEFFEGSRFLYKGSGFLEGKGVDVWEVYFLFLLMGFVRVFGYF